MERNSKISGKGTRAGGRLVCDWSCWDSDGSTIVMNTGWMQATVWIDDSDN